MRHLFFIISILVVSVFTTACINNFAVKELNTNAKKYINSGDIDSAICRLKSSLELDNQVWETHYNLGIAYLTAGKLEDAQQEFETTISLNPEMPDSYYSLGVCLEQQADIIAKGKDEADDENEEVVEEAVEQNFEMDESTKVLVVAKLRAAGENYHKFLKNTDNKEDKAKVQEKIESLEKEIDDLKKETLE